MDEPYALRGRLVLPDRIVEDGVLVVHGDRIVEVADASDGWADGRKGPVEQTGTLAPGFLDVHCHGGGGHAVTTGVPDDVSAVVRHHAVRGTTSVVASLVSATEPDLLAALGAIAEVTADEPGLLGSHLEGPWLAHGHCGAHDPAVLTAPDPTVAQRWIDAAGGTLRMVTLAPELPGAAESAAVLDAAGVLVAAGHTDADAGAFGAALATDHVRTVTHLFNGMAPFHHRDPGPGGATLRALAAGHVHAELISDGIHLADETVAMVFAVAAERVVLVSDAMSAAGMPDGRYLLGGLEVEVRDATAWTTGERPALAGSTIHVADAVRRAIVHAGVAPHLAVRAATLTPADLVGATDRGRFAPGARADVVVLDDDWRVTRVMQGGAWLA
ncbi:MAG: N-acetylglucosamine-6-phosphate deacetylase [Nocardioides sp.]|uniref:N-acetylglucosamine-6-phosphate deacetylase n=1 Tax=Nocardioides sp. TaxID=35761 RepID=UPI003EFE2509